MKLSFLPGELQLVKNEEGDYLVTIQNREVVRTKSQKAALAKYAELRREMETRFPLRQLSPEEKAEILGNAIRESLLSHNSPGGRKKKTTAGSTRTFGG